MFIAKYTFSRLVLCVSKPFTFVCYLCYVDLCSLYDYAFCLSPCALFVPIAWPLLVYDYVFGTILYYAPASASVPTPVRDTAERNFSITQECVIGLTVISINYDVSQNLSFDAVIDDFAAKKFRCVQFWDNTIKNAGLFFPTQTLGWDLWVI